MRTLFQQILPDTLPVYIMPDVIFSTVIEQEHLRTTISTSASASTITGTLRGI